jgi:hypothetical protein
MKFISAIDLLVHGRLLIAASPWIPPARKYPGSYTVSIWGASEQAITSVCGTTLSMTTAMPETCLPLPRAWILNRKMVSHRGLSITHDLLLHTDICNIRKTEDLVILVSSRKIR